MSALSRYFTAVVVEAHGMHTAAGLWALAFGLFVARYARALLGPRVDGRPG